jgi:hypothetical protein
MEAEPKPHPLQPRTATECLLFSTLRLIGLDENQDEISTGSGFVLGLPTDEPDQVKEIVVTNKHVVENTASIKFIVHEKLSDGRVSMRNSDVIIPTKGWWWVAHPDPAVDLCGFTFGQLRAVAKQHLKRDLYTQPVPLSFLPTEKQLDDLRPLENVTMLGYPNGLVDELHNLPLARRGMTSTPPMVDFNGKPEFLIDLACFPGSSGSPVFFLEEGPHVDRSGNLVFNKRAFLLGVLWGGPLATAEGEVLRVVSKYRAFVDNPMHLGVVIKARELLHLHSEFLKLQKLHLPPTKEV